MERHDILKAMSDLKLYGMRASFDEIAGKGLPSASHPCLLRRPGALTCSARRDEIYLLVASLIRSERTHRQARSISYRLGGRQVPGAQGLRHIRVRGDADEGQVRELATGAFVDAKRNTIFIGNSESDS